MEKNSMEEMPRASKSPEMTVGEMREKFLTPEERQELKEIEEKLKGVSVYEIWKNDELYELVQKGRELNKKAISTAHEQQK